ncbi:LOW QUALITY PROTEIN: olfactory receptor 6X1-like [Discoglossus pictus]
MLGDNETRITEVVLLGFQSRYSIQILIFFLLLVIYVVTLTGNLLIVVLVSASRRLQSPMYFFLQHLSFCDVLLTTNIVPNTLHVMIVAGSRMSLNGCLIASAIIEGCLLPVMSYDRYMAICYPLRYTAVMGFRLCLRLVISSWLLGSVISFMSSMLINTLVFCGPNIIDHFFCDLGPVLNLACSDSSIVEIEVSIVTIQVGVFQLVFIFVTYIHISINILRISTTSSRQKAFSTCISHLTVVCTYYGTMIILYVIPSKGRSLNLNKFLSRMNTVATPLLNPIIYSLRNQEIKTAFGQVIDFPNCLW